MISNTFKEDLIDLKNGVLGMIPNKKRMLKNKDVAFLLILAVASLFMAVEAILYLSNNF